MPVFRFRCLECGYPIQVEAHSLEQAQAKLSTMTLCPSANHGVLLTLRETCVTEAEYREKYSPAS